MGTAEHLMHAYRNEVIVQPPWAQDPELLRHENQRRGVLGRGGSSVGAPAGRQLVREREDGVGHLFGLGSTHAATAPAHRAGTSGGRRASAPTVDERRAVSRDAA